MTSKKRRITRTFGNYLLRGGFFQRSKDIFLRILKFSPRNKNALIHLLLVFEKLKDYKKQKK